MLILDPCNWSGCNCELCQLEDLLWNLNPLWFYFGTDIVGDC